MLCCSPFVGLLIPRVDQSGVLKTVGVVNTRIDVQGPVRIRVSGLPASEKYLVWRELKKKPLKLRLERSDGSTYVVIPEIAPWSAGFLYVK